MLKRICTFLSLLGIIQFQILVMPGFAAGEDRVSFRPNGFSVSDEIQGRIDFWKVIFTKYGANHLVFHHREHPQIIYSVLDMTEFNASYSGKELTKVTNRAVEDEYNRIELMLARLADTGQAANPAERRLYYLFNSLPGRVNANLREAAQEEFIRYQKGIKELFRDGLVRSGRYLHAMEKVFRQEGLPVELCRLPLVESSFNYNAYSSVGAAGIWQFMRGTGKKYLRVDSFVDERKDPIMATRAAARYLAYSYEKTGSWPLSVTSYNHGLSGIMRAANVVGTKDLGTIIRNYDGESFGFASKNFYAEFMAALEVEQNAKHYFPGIEREDPWHFDEVRLGQPATYREIVQNAGASDEEVENLNRALLAPILKGRAKIPAGMIVRVPRGRGTHLNSRLARAELLGSDEGAEEVLARGPAKQKAAPVVVAKNEEESNASDISSSSESVPSEPKQYYRVGAGDNLGKIAKRNGVSLQALLAANPGINSKKLKPGARITLPEGGSDREPTRVIAQSKGAARAEKVKTAPNKADDKQNDARARAEAEKILNSKGEQKKYSVQKGDTLSSISKQQGMSVARLKKLNPKAAKKLSIGQELILE